MESAKKQNRKSPNDYPFVGIRPTKEQIKRLKRLAKASSRSVSELYVMAMEQALPTFESQAAAATGKKF